jgi:hypothetical protein
MRISPTKRCQYPTGLETEEVELSNNSRSLLITIEKCIRRNRTGGGRIGCYTVSGSVVPRGATGLIRHESLWGGETISKACAWDIARKLFARFEKIAE